MENLKQFMFRIIGLLIVSIVIIAIIGFCKAILTFISYLLGFLIVKIFLGFLLFFFLLDLLNVIRKN